MSQQQKIIASPGRAVAGAARVPGDKSISHRALMLGALAETYPGPGPITADVSVAIDGEITTGGRQTAIGPENEIYLMQRMKGG